MLLDKHHLDVDAGSDFNYGRLGSAISIALRDILPGESIPEGVFARSTKWGIVFERNYHSRGQFVLPHYIGYIVQKYGLTGDEPRTFAEVARDNQVSFGPVRTGVFYVRHSIMRRSVVRDLVDPVIKKLNL